MPMDPRQGHFTPRHETWQMGTEVVASYKFPGGSLEDLPFNKGDILTIIKPTTDPNWYQAKNTYGREGMIPANYVQKRQEVSLQTMPWYHGKVSREDAESLLDGQRIGSYLVRENGHYPGDYTLSLVIPGDVVEHYRVLQTNNKVEVDGGDLQFDTLLELVEACRCPCAGWFHGKITRQAAEDLLNMMEDGLFLLRESQNYPGDYTLCVCHRRKVEHYHIVYFNNKLTIDKEVFFDSLPQLVEHYEKDADGLCTRLSKPLWKAGNNFTTVNLKDFERGGWVINPDHLEMKEPIGKGEFGDVYKGSYNRQLVAVKQLKERHRAAQTFLKEASVMTSMRHPNLVQLIGVVLGETIFLVTEYMGKGNLVEYLRSRGRSVITKKDQINFATDTSAGMAYLEAKNLVHRDLAARNVLVHEDGTAKVSDFGLAKFEEYSQEGGRFPIKWTAPEAIRKNVFTSKSDVWSFGILLWEIYSFGRVPYPRIPLTEVVRHVERGYRMETPDGCPPEVYRIMRQTWDIDPNHRPLFKDILNMLHNMRATTV